MDAASGIAAQIAQARTDVAYSSLKANANQEKQLANILQSAISSVPGSPIRGVNVNVKA